MKIIVKIFALLTQRCCLYIIIITLILTTMRTGVNTHPGTLKFILENYTSDDVVNAFISYNEGNEDIDAKDFVIDTPLDEIIEALIDECEYRGDEVLDIMDKNRAAY